MSQGTVSDIKISKTQIRKAIKHGVSLFGSLMSLGSKLIPMAMPLAKKAIALLPTGAFSGLASLGVDKLFGKGQRGGAIDQNTSIYYPQARKRIFLMLSNQAVN